MGWILELNTSLTDDVPQSVQKRKCASEIYIFRKVELSVHSEWCMFDAVGKNRLVYRMSDSETKHAENYTSEKFDSATNN